MSGCLLINVDIITPTQKRYSIVVEGSLCRGLIHVFFEIDDMECKSWIYHQLNDKITKSIPDFTGSYLGYTWKKT